LFRWGVRGITNFGFFAEEFPEPFCFSNAPRFYSLRQTAPVVASRLLNVFARRHLTCR
jgi:hypothetical protein